ncbi:hypothetical protein BH23BAC1_BH23BAC1_08190 [soil metagenome]
MIRLTVLYPNSEGSYFDMDYYLQIHVPLVKKRLTTLGLTQVVLEQGIAGIAPDSPSPYYVIGSLNFNSLEDLQNSLATHSEELVADISNFTDVQAEMVISQVVKPIENMASIKTSGI